MPIQYMMSPNVSFKGNVFLLIFYLDDLTIDVSGLLKLPSSQVMLSIFPYLAVNVLLCWV